MTKQNRFITEHLVEYICTRFFTSGKNVKFPNTYFLLTPDGIPNICFSLLYPVKCPQLFQDDYLTDVILRKGLQFLNSWDKVSQIYIYI
jgi:hypothetical protein